MYIWFMLTLTLGVDVAAQSGKEIKTTNAYLTSIFKRIEMQKQKTSRNATFNKEGIDDSQDETKENRFSIETKWINVADRFETGDSSDKHNTDNTTNVSPYSPSEKEEEIERVKYLTSDEVKECKISVAEQSIQYFQSQLLKNEPHFVQFRILLTGNTTHISTKDVFQGGRWYWTYNTSAGPFPFLSWNLDYGLLTFGLLDAKTIHIPYVYLNVTSGCSIKYGSNLTSFQITKALVSLVNFKELKHDYIKYRESYFCYLVTNKHLLGTLKYYAAQYLIYPCSFVSYKCCTVNYNYTSQKLYHSCPEGKIPGVRTWTQTYHVPFILEILLFAFCPITMFKFFAWTAKRDKIVGNDLEENPQTSVEGFELIEEEENWIYADGIKSPLTFYDLFSFDVLGLYNEYPILTSRLRRLLCLMFAPLLIYLQTAWYSRGLGVWDDGDKITVKDLVEAGTPMGFLSILADPENKYKTFVPGLGGPLAISVMYFSLGILFMVLPRCLKQIVEDGLPNSNLYIPSPLFFGYNEIVKMSQIKVEPEHLVPGYTKGSTLMKCSFYLLFTTKFWIRVWRIQTRRFPCFGERTNTCFCAALAIFVLPLYIVFCIIEIILCLLYYGLPVCFFVVVMVKGATRALGYLKYQSRFLSWVFSFKIFIVAGVTVVFTMFSLLAYIVGLLFIKSFGIVAQVITLCFIAVIIYPSVSFGYLFFFVIVLYYFIKQIRNFSDVYTELLTTAVDKSKAMAQEPYHVTLLEGYLSVSNVNCESLKGIQINGNIINNTEENIMVQDIKGPLTIREKDDVYGIPRGLFDFLVKKHRPIHQQFLTLVFKVSIMVAFIFLTLSISSNYVTGPTTEISEVMHVIFIVVVGVIPQLIGVAFANSNSVLVREIEERKIEHSIIEYWSTK